MPLNYGILNKDYRLSMRNPFRLFHYRRDPYCDLPPPDMHYAVHFGVMLEGTMEFHYSTHGRILQLQPGDIFLTAPWEPHCDRGLQQKIDVVNFAVLPERVGMIGVDSDWEWLAPFLTPVENRISTMRGALRQRLLKLANEAAALVTEGEDTATPAAWLRFHEMLLLLIDMPSGASKRQAGNSSPSGINRILPAVYLVRTCQDRPVSLGQAAAACSLGRSRFSSLFQRAMGISFGQFAARARIASVSRAMLQPGTTLKEIASQFGFFDASHFCRVFREHYGCSPQSFRKRLVG